MTAERTASTAKAISYALRHGVDEADFLPPPRRWFPSSRRLTASSRASY
jgi:hypothetical protein